MDHLSSKLYGLVVATYLSGMEFLPVFSFLVKMLIAHRCGLELFFGREDRVMRDCVRKKTVSCFLMVACWDTGN